MTRALAASRPGGVFLCLGRGAGEMAAWIFDGMDLSGRLVIVLQTDQEADALRALLDDDMRITVHVQDAVTFLGDVRDHRFDLITDLNPAQSADRSADLGRLALTRLAPGAFYLSLHSARHQNQGCGCDTDKARSNLHWVSPHHMLVRPSGAVIGCFIAPAAHKCHSSAVVGHRRLRQILNSLLNLSERFPIVAICGAHGSD